MFDAGPVVFCATAVAYPAHTIEIVFRNLFAGQIDHFVEDYPV